MAAEKHLGDIYYERERTPWYWRALGTTSASLILLGFLFFPFSFPTSSATSFNQSALSVVAVSLLALGYALSVALWFICRSWLFQLDVVFVYACPRASKGAEVNLSSPCLSSCVLGALNVVFNLAIRPSNGSIWTVGAVSALALSLVSATAYAVLSISTYTKLCNVRSRGLVPSHSDDLEDPHRKAFAQLLSSTTNVCSQNKSLSAYQMNASGKAETRLGSDAESLGDPSSIYSMIPSSLTTPRSVHSTIPSPPATPQWTPPIKPETDAASNPLVSSLRSARERALQRVRQRSEVLSSHSTPATEKPASESAGVLRQPQRFDFAVRANGEDPEELDARMALPRDVSTGDVVTSPLSQEGEP